MCREFAYVVGLYPCVAPPALLPGRWIAQGDRHRNKQTEMERDYMNFLQNRPRKLMATAALSVPLLAAGSTVVFSTAASAAVTCNKPDHSCGNGQPTGQPTSPAPTCTCMHTTPPP